MFDLGWSKLIIIAMVAIVVVGPKDLPALLRTIGKFVGQLRKQADDFRRQFDEAMRDTELDQIRKDVEDIKRTAHESVSEITRTAEESVKPLEQVTAEMNQIGNGTSLPADTAANGELATHADALSPPSSTPIPQIATELPAPALPSSAPELPKTGA